MNWNVFQTIWSALDVPLEGAVSSAVSSVSAWVSGPFRWWVLVYLICVLAIAACSPSEGDVGAWWRHLWRAVAVYWAVAYSGNFSAIFGNMALTILPQQLGQALSGATRGTTPFGVNSFDALFNFVFSSGLQAYNGLPLFSIKAAFLTLFILAFMLLALVAIAEMFLVYLTSHVVVALAIAIGPALAALYMWEMTRRYFFGWMGVVLGAVLTQVLAVGLLAIYLRITQTEIATLKTNLTVDNIGTALLSLFSMMLLFYVGYRVSSHIWGIGQSIGGGIYMHGGQVANAIRQGMQEFSRAAAAAASGGAAGTAGAAAFSAGGGSNGGTGGAPGNAPSRYSFQRTVGKIP